MYRRALLLALVVCSASVLVAAVPPAAAGPLSEPADGSDDAGADDDAWYDGWGSDDEDRDEHESERDDEDDRNSEDDEDDRNSEDDEDDRNSEDDSLYWGDDEDDTNTADASAPDAGDDGNASHDDRDDSIEQAEQNGTERRNETERKNGTGDAEETSDHGAKDHDGDDQTGNLTGRVLELANGTIRPVTDGVERDLDGDGDPDVSLVDVDDGTVEVGGLPDETSDGVEGSDGGIEAVELELDDDLLDDRGRLRAGNVTVGGAIVVPLGPPDILPADDPEGASDDRPSMEPPAVSDAGTEPTPADDTTAVTVDGSGSDDSGDDTEADEEAGPATGDDSEGAGGAGGPEGSGAGAGAAMVVTVGLLGGTRTALDQTAILASQGPGTTLTTLRHVVGGYLDDLPGSVLLALFGYSRRDGSDPLENETRADIYDLVLESPGTYHAQLAEETGVAVETIRYHSRILAEEGLVEARKIRGRRRLFPVTMDDDDPELAAAIADSAASDVLSVIERREPTTLSAIAEAVDCAPSTVSYHVDRLEDDGLVTRERDGGAVRVRLRRSTRSALQSQVADD